MQLTINKVDVSLVSKDGAVFANSLDIAKVFEKEHKNVLRIIDNMSERGKRNFEPTSYIDSFNRSQKMYEMNRDGFSFLVMGFTGEKADNFKLDFIDGFNKLENEVKKVQSQSTQIQLLQETINQLSIMDNRVSNTESEVEYLKNKAPITYNQIKVLEDKRKAITRELVGYDTNSEISKANYSKTIRTLTRKFKDVFGVARYADLPKDKYYQAINWLNGVKLVDLI